MTQNKQKKSREVDSETVWFNKTCHRTLGKERVGKCIGSHCSAWITYRIEDGIVIGVCDAA